MIGPDRLRPAPVSALVSSSSLPWWSATAPPGPPTHSRSAACHRPHPASDRWPHYTPGTRLPLSSRNRLSAWRSTHRPALAALSAGGGSLGSLQTSLDRASAARIRSIAVSLSSDHGQTPPPACSAGPAGAPAPPSYRLATLAGDTPPAQGPVVPRAAQRPFHRDRAPPAAAPTPAPSAKRGRTGAEAATDVMSTATRLGLTGPLVDPLTGDGPADHGPDAVGQTLVDSLRLTFRARAVVSTDVPRLRTALIWFEAFLTATGRTPFRPAFGAANTIGQMWNAESLELFAEFVRRSTPRGRTRGTSVSSNSISGYVSAIRLLRSREARYPVAPPEIDLNLPLALKAMRIEDGPSGARARSLGVRAETLSNAASAGADRGSAQGAVDWAAAVIAHNAILRGGEVGVQCGRDPDPSRVISWKSFGWQAPRAESLWRPWLILSVVPIKDPRGSKSAYPIPVPRRHDGPMGSDPLCPYDAAAIAWWLRCAPRGQPFPVDARGWPLPDWHLTAPPPRPGAPFFTDASGTVMDTTYVRNLARRLARLGGMPEADVADVGGKAFRIGGATDLRYECGEQGAPLVKQRGRWDSDVAAVYMRPLLGMQLSAAAAVGSVRGAGLEELCAGFAQRAVRGC